MCKFDKSQVKITQLIFFVLSMTCIMFNNPSAGTILHAREGETVALNFSYPCDSTTTTLRHGYKLPFYNSAKQDNPTPLRYDLQHFEDSGTDATCLVRLTINPVSRDDEGTFILSVYNGSELLPDYPRIGLRVGYPPGKASCGSSSGHLDGVWMKLHCTAPKGNIAGQIQCYQNSLRLPHLNRPVERGGSLHQVILARMTNHFVQCCSSIFDQTKTISQCVDGGWDPVKNEAITNMTDWNTTPSPFPQSATNLLPGRGSNAPSSNQTLIPDAIESKKMLLKRSLIIVIGLLSSFIIIMIIVTCIKCIIIKKISAQNQHVTTCTCTGLRDMTSS
ncbi:uncharacterized protein LOC121421690 [Lytechinus variegatus]|uniref:uncharacterized protein LOC121421690 n=1 Tax=Lytechinus variegatus TaxID=7654 RepID=UPI001BB2CE02|nr:uncharacterized protein LOC121421690 [Lytechinus variegatus]